MNKDSIYTIRLPSGGVLPVTRYRFQNGEGPRVAFVAGIRGDAPEGIRVAFKLIRMLEQLEPLLQGCIDVFPVVNPLAAEQGSRLWPSFALDQNRQFPGKEDGHPPAQLAHLLMQELEGISLLVELRGARPGFEELPQAMIQDDHKNLSLFDDVTLLDVARQCNTSLVWCRKSGRSANRTLAYQFAQTIVLEGGQGNRLTSSAGEVLGDGCLYLLTRTGVLPEEHLPFPWVAMDDPQIAGDDRIERVRIERAGLFLPSVALGDVLNPSDEIGIVVDPRTGEIVERIESVHQGVVIAIRNQPVVTPGEMVARVFISVEDIVGAM
jgi:predicted deacylase